MAYGSAESRINIISYRFRYDVVVSQRHQYDGVSHPVPHGCLQGGVKLLDEFNPINKTLNLDCNACVVDGY